MALRQVGHPLVAHCLISPNPQTETPSSTQSTCGLLHQKQFDRSLIHVDDKLISQSYHTEFAKHFPPRDCFSIDPFPSANLNALINPFVPACLPRFVAHRYPPLAETITSSDQYAKRFNPCLINGYAVHPSRGVPSSRPPVLREHIRPLERNT